MLFRPELCDKILSGEKTQTRRVVKPGDRAGAYSIPGTVTITEVSRNGRRLWQVGRCYAVQPGRGRPAVAHIRLTNIRHGHLQDISREECFAEGVAVPELPEGFADWEIIALFFELWDSINTRHGIRSSDNPPVWILEFELSDRK